LLQLPKGPFGDRPAPLTPETGVRNPYGAPKKSIT
jgi:hypothetical protein